MRDAGNGGLEMRTTLAIDDDVHAAAKDLAATQRKSVGEVISLLARRALRPADPGQKLVTACLSCRQAQIPLG
jgi:hypothetical protein